MNSFTGLYEGIVLDNNDPSDRLRLKIRVIGIHDERLTASDLPWAVCGAYPYTGNKHGELRRPNVNSNVFVQFKNGHVDFPVWTAQPVYAGDMRNTDERIRIAGAYRLDIKLERDINVWGSSTTRVGGVDYLHIVRSQRTFVGGNQTLEVKGSRESSYDGSVRDVVRGSYTVDTGAFSLQVKGLSESSFGGDKSESIAGKLDVEIGGNKNLHAKALQIDTEGPVTIRTEGGTIRVEKGAVISLKSAGIYVDGVVELGAGEGDTPGQYILLEPAVTLLKSLANLISALSGSLGTLSTSLGTAVPALTAQASATTTACTTLVSGCATFNDALPKCITSRVRAT
jgi:hypothetical protein